ncbi:MAG: GNAT family N-acetyltransferase [Bacteroidales bacterium]|nr:GNAT family N-acetyltransferase [Bacteroidales bacterium]
MYNLRKANKGDESKIMEVVKTVLSDYGLKTNPDETDRDICDLENYYFNRNGWFAVIENDREIIGSYGIFMIDKKSCELRKMYLLKDYQGQGLGKILMDNAINKAKELGYSIMVLETNKLLGKAISMYEKYGFVQYSPSHLSDRCDFAMRKKL